MDWDRICYNPYSIFEYFLRPATLSDACQMLLSSSTWLPLMNYKEYALLFAMVCALEAPLYLNIQSLSWRKRFAALVGLNLATHPAITFLLPALLNNYGFSTAGLILTTETLAFLVEAFILYFAFKVGAKTAFVFALLANLFSWSFGLYLIV